MRQALHRRRRQQLLKIIWRRLVRGFIMPPVQCVEHLTCRDLEPPLGPTDGLGLPPNVSELPPDIVLIPPTHGCVAGHTSG